MRNNSVIVYHIHFSFLLHTEILSYGGTQFYIFKIQMLIVKFGIQNIVNGQKMLIFSIIFMLSKYKKNRLFNKDIFFLHLQLWKSKQLKSYYKAWNWKVI